MNIYIYTSYKLFVRGLFEPQTLSDYNRWNPQALIARTRTLATKMMAHSKASFASLRSGLKGLRV